MNKLAIDGGSPTRSLMLPYSRQTIDAADRLAVDEVLNSNWLTTGPKVEEFETKLSQYTGSPYCSAVSSGTAALHLALLSAGIGPGDEVIVPAISFVASANCVLYVGATPIFADLEIDTLNVNSKSIREKISKKTKAIIIVDFAGHPCEHREIRLLADEFDLLVIEDAAHSLGAEYFGKKVGILQDITTFSFHPVKHITTGEGGMVLTSDHAVIQKIRSFRHHGIDVDLHSRNKTNTWQYDVINLGYNYRLPDINCALGISQLTKSDNWLERRQHIANRYARELKGLPIQLPFEKEGCKSSWHLYFIRLELEKIRVGRTQIFAALRAENIGVNVHYIPIPWLSYYRKLGFKKGEWPIAENEYERLISIPIFPSMSENDIEDVISALKKVIQGYMY